MLSRNMSKRPDGLVIAIGLFKLVKGLILLTLGVAGILAMPEDLASAAERVVGWMGTFSGRGTIEQAIGKLWSIDRSTSEKLGILSLCYASVFFVEGVGLVRKRAWAEWMTVFVTASFVPMEIYELVERFTAARVMALVLNISIVVYLAWSRLQDRSTPVRRAKGIVTRVHELLRRISRAGRQRRPMRFG